jgi:tetratricopeptide (TPR) repeat protein
MDLAEIERVDGNLDRALELLTRGDEILATAGERSYRATIQALLAQVRELLGDRDGAGAAIALVDELGATHDTLNYAFTHAVRARLALAAGEHDVAERCAREGVGLASASDFTAMHADLELELARILAALRRLDEAIATAHAALELYKTKGDRPGAAITTALLDELRGR